MNKEYQQIGTEGDEVLSYTELLEFAKENSDTVKLHGGFIPSTYAMDVLYKGEENVIPKAIEKDYISKDVKNLISTELHFKLF